MTESRVKGGTHPLGHRNSPRQRATFPHFWRRYCKTCYLHIKLGSITAGMAPTSLARVLLRVRWSCTDSSLWCTAASPTVRLPETAHVTPGHSLVWEDPYAGVTRLCLQRLLSSPRPLPEQHLEPAGDESKSSWCLRRGKDGHTATDGLTKSGQEPTHRHFICKKLF